MLIDRVFIDLAFGMKTAWPRVAGRRKSAMCVRNTPLWWFSVALFSTRPEWIPSRTHSLSVDVPLRMYKSRARSRYLLSPSAETSTVCQHRSPTPFLRHCASYRKAYGLLVSSAHYVQDGNSLNGVHSVFASGPAFAASSLRSQRRIPMTASSTST